MVVLLQPSWPNAPLGPQQEAWSAKDLTPESAQAGIHTGGQHQSTSSPTKVVSTSMAVYQASAPIEPLSTDKYSHQCPTTHTGAELPVPFKGISGASGSRVTHLQRRVCVTACTGVWASRCPPPSRAGQTWSRWHSPQGRHRGQLPGVRDPGGHSRQPRWRTHRNL